MLRMRFYDFRAPFTFLQKITHNNHALFPMKLDIYVNVENFLLKSLNFYKQFPVHTHGHITPNSQSNQFGFPNPLLSNYLACRINVISIHYYSYIQIL